MKFFAPIILLSLFAITSCKEDVDINGDYVETAVVLGILEQEDSVHFIKITRAFIGDGQTSTTNLAMIPDSNYFNQVDAVVEERQSNGLLVRSWTLHDTLIPNKEEGAFYNPTQKVYVFYANDLNPDYTYSLKASIDNGKFEISGSTRLIKGFAIDGTLSNPNYALRFADNTPGEYLNQLIGYASPASPDAVRFAAKLRFTYRDYTTSTTFTDKTITWNLGEIDKEDVTGAAFTAPGQSFYQFIADNVPVDNTLFKRRMEAIEIEMTAVNDEFATYIDVSQPSSGIAQTKPEFTNLTVTNGRNVRGVFTTRATITVNKPTIYQGSSVIRNIDSKSMRELCTGPITGLLGFCSQHDADNFQSYNCP